MFNFFKDFGNYEERKVGRWTSDDEKQTISTARCSDGRQPFETAVSHPDYNSGKWIIVAAYNTRADALCGHEKWVAMASTDTLPDPLVDVCNAGVAEFGKAVCKDWQTEFPRQKK